jgi:hypothetical protein
MTPKHLPRKFAGKHGKLASSLTPGRGPGNSRPRLGGCREPRSGQKPQWQNRVRQDFKVDGYVLDGKFLTVDEANQRGKENPELLTRFRKATKRGDKIHVMNPALCPQ